MNKLKFYAIGLVLVLVGFGNSNKIHAQDKKLDNPINFGSQLRFSLSAHLYDNLKLNHQAKVHLKALPALGGEGGISYYQHIYNGYGIDIGARYGIAPHYLHYRFKVPENNIFYSSKNDVLDFNDYAYSCGIYTFPVNLSKIFYYKKMLFSIGIGAKFHLPISVGASQQAGSAHYIDEDNPNVEEFTFVLKNTNKKYLVSYPLKFGIIKKTKKYNSFNFNVVLNYSPNKLAKGWYKFYELGYDSYGTIEQNINYIGFECVYGFTLIKSKKPIAEN